MKMEALNNQLDLSLALAMGQEYLAINDEVSRLALLDLMEETNTPLFFFFASVSLCYHDMYLLGSRSAYARTIMFPLEINLKGLSLISDEEWVNQSHQALIPTPDGWIECGKITVTILHEGGYIEAKSYDQTAAAHLVDNEHKHLVEFLIKKEDRPTMEIINL